MGSPGWLCGCSCRVRHHPPHPRGAGRAGGTGAKPRVTRIRCWWESPDRVGTAGKEHDTAQSPRGPVPRENPGGSGLRAVAESGVSMGGSWGHGAAQPGGRDSISGESTGSSSKSQSFPEMDSLTAGSCKNCIFQKLDPLSARSSFKELDPSTGSSESWIL